MNIARIIAVTVAFGLTFAARAAAERVVVVDREAVVWNEEAPERADGDFVYRHGGQTVERTIDLPPAPAPPDARGITMRVHVEPIESEHEGRPRPNDPWTRIGSVSVLADDSEVEILRFATGYGATTTFEEDVTPFAPLLHGRRTIRAFIATYSDRPGFRISVELIYREDAGARRPIVARSVVTAPHVIATEPTIEATLVVPAGIDVPRLRVISTGHATDGQGAHEFVSSTHILSIDGQEIARWRPWSESGTSVRATNPYAARFEIDGRTYRASDFDRAGWHPGRLVTPLVIPVPELSAGRHELTLTIEDIRPREEGGAHGYWTVSIALVADAAWPE